jgi:imidazolonepropionase-like amidohydrolase
MRQFDSGLRLYLSGLSRLTRLMKPAFRCLLLVAFLSSAHASESVIINAGHVVDVAAGKVLDKQMIWIEDERIKEIGSNLQPPANAKILDLPNAWVLPGLIDCHTHITFQIANYFDDTFRKSPVDAAIIAHVYARRTLEAGFTACRDLGSGEFVDVALRKAIDNQSLPGPRLFVAGHALSATGGHGDLSGFSPYLSFKNFDGVVDGVDEIRKKIRWNIKYGVDVIKFTATAGVMSEEESFGAPQFSTEEMKAIVEESTMWGRKVAAHAHGTEGIKRAVRAGVTSIEHGSILDDEAISLMKEHGTYLVPTVYVGFAVEEHAKEWHLPDRLLAKARAINKEKLQGLQKAIQAGVKIAYGTDAGVFPHGENAKDFDYLVRAGMSPIQAIQCATIAASELIGQSTNFGTLTPGKFADLIAVTSDPTRDVKSLEKISFVMKGGRIYKNQLASGGAQP